MNGWVKDEWMDKGWLVGIGIDHKTQGWAQAQGLPAALPVQSGPRSESDPSS